MIGRALGGAVALSLLNEMKDASILKGVIIESAFTNSQDVSDILFPFLKLLGPLRSMVIKNRWNNLEQVKTVTCPILFISGDKDQLVPVEMTKRLHSACASQRKEVWIVAGGNHNNTFSVGGSIYVTKLQSFFWKCRSIKQSTPT